MLLEIGHSTDHRETKVLKTLRLHGRRGARRRCGRHVFPELSGLVFGTAAGDKHTGQRYPETKSYKTRPGHDDPSIYRLSNQGMTTKFKRRKNTAKPLNANIGTLERLRWCSSMVQFLLLRRMSHQLHPSAAATPASWKSIWKSWSRKRLDAVPTLAPTAIATAPGIQQRLASTAPTKPAATS